MPFSATVGVVRLKGGICMHSHMFGNNHEVNFLNQAEGQEAILDDSQEAFFKHLTEVDIEARMGRQLKGNYTQVLSGYMNFLTENVLEFTYAESAGIVNVLEKIQGVVVQSLPGFVPSVFSIIKTSGKEESNACYTRSGSIIFPSSKLKASLEDEEKLAYLLAHEMSHLYTRFNPDIKRELYGKIGFNNVGKINLGNFLSKRRLTNPDAPDLSYVIEVAFNGRPVTAMPVTYSNVAGFDPAKESFFEYLSFGLVEVHESDSGFAVANADDPIVISPRDAVGFFEQIGRNTEYIIHPEEIVADNLAFAILSWLGYEKADYDWNVLSLSKNL